MSEIRNLTRNGETFYPLTHVEGLLDNQGNVVGEINDIFDISEYHASGTPPVLATYASLDLALAAVPETKRKGGMTIRYVQTSDNKYVQYFYTSTAVEGTPNPFLDVDNWQLCFDGSADIINAILSEAFQYSNIQKTNGVVTSASITWPDSATGTMTVTYTNGLPTSVAYSYIKGGATDNYTQTITYSNGEVVSNVVNKIINN